MSGSQKPLELSSLARGLYPFVLGAPPGALAVASAMPAKLWKDDLPYTILDRRPVSRAM